MSRETKPKESFVCVSSLLPGPIVVRTMHWPCLAACKPPWEGMKVLQLEHSFPLSAFRFGTCSVFACIPKALPPSAAVQQHTAAAHWRPHLWLAVPAFSEASQSPEQL